MSNEFEKTKDYIINKVLRLFPKPLRVIVVILILVGGGIIAWKGELFRNRFPDQGRSDAENHGFLAHQIWTETQSNLKTLKRFLEEKEKFSFREKPAHFIYDTYSKYNGQLGEQMSSQIDNFYKNLKRIENNEPYTRDEILKVIGQGQDVLNFLKQDFGLKDYFENNQGIRIASAHGTSVLRPSRTSDNIVSADNTTVVSADLPILTLPPYGSIGEDSSEGKDGKLNS